MSQRRRRYMVWAKKLTRAVHAISTPAPVICRLSLSILSSRLTTFVTLHDHWDTKPEIMTLYQRYINTMHDIVPAKTVPLSANHATVASAVDQPQATRKATRGIPVYQVRAEKATSIAISNIPMPQLCQTSQHDRAHRE